MTDVEMGHDLIRIDLVLRDGLRVSGRLGSTDKAFERLLTAFAGGQPETDARVVGLLTPDKQGTIFIRPSDVTTIEVDRWVQPEAHAIIANRDVPSIGRSVPALQPRPYFVVSNFLRPETYEALLDFTMKRETDYQPSTITDKTTGIDSVDTVTRQSMVLYDLGLMRSVFVEKLTDILPQVVAAPGMDEARRNVGRIECQMTCHASGGFFKAHRDNEGGKNTSRFISYVYYYNKTPRSFSGGALKITQTKPDGSSATHNVEPLDNSIVFFDSSFWHEVTPIRCKTEEFSSSRFTVNGWIHRRV